MKIQRDEIFFYIGMILQFTMTTFLITTQKIPYSQCFVAVIILSFGVKILTTKYTQSELMIIVFLLLVSAVCYVKQGDSKVLRIVLMFIAAKNIQSRRLLKVLFACYFFILFSVPIMCVITGNGKLSLYGTFGIGRVATTRYMLGFDGPNRLSGVWICLLATIVLLRNKKNVWLDLVLIVITAGIYKITVSRTGLIAGLIIIAFPYIYGWGPKFIRKILEKKVLLWTLIAILGLTIIAAVAYGPLLEKLNVIFNNRMSFLSTIFHGDKISLWGTDLNFQEKYGGGMDNSYFNMLYTNGLVFISIYIFALLRYIKISGKNVNDFELSVAFMFIAIAYVQEMIDIPFVNYMYFLFMIHWNDMMKVGRIKERHNYNDINKNQEMVKKTFAYRGC